MVVNDKEHMVKSIVQFNVRDFKFLLTRSFLQSITKPGMGNGVARDNYYIVNVDGILRIPSPAPVGEYKMFLKLLEACQTKGFTYLMLTI